MNKELLRMQMLAGILTEGQYKAKLNEEENLSPEQAVQKAISLAPKLEKSSKLDQLAQKVANDPDLLSQMEKALQKGGITLNENENNLDVQDMKTIALNLAKKSLSLKELNELEYRSPFDEEDEEVTWEDGGAAAAYFSAFAGGGTLAGYFSSTILSIFPSLLSIFAGPAIAGAVAGVALVALARKVYTMMK
jgi:hypothetical protein